MADEKLNTSTEEIFGTEEIFEVVWKNEKGEPVKCSNARMKELENLGYIADIIPTEEMFEYKRVGRNCLRIAVPGNWFNPGAAGGDYTDNPKKHWQPPKAA
jgi:hypothetical protein